MSLPPDPAGGQAPADAPADGVGRLVVAVVSPTSLGTQAAHEVTPAVRALAEVVRVRTLAELFSWAGGGHSVGARAVTESAGADAAPADSVGSAGPGAPAAEPATVALIIATDEVGSLDDVAAAVAHYPALASARMVLLTERAELHDLGRAIDEDLVREVIAVPWTPGAIGERARAQIRRWMRDHLPAEDPRRLRDGNGLGHSPLLEALTHRSDALTAELIAACEQVLGPRPRLRLPAGVRLTHQGQIVDGVYVVVSGSVALTRHTRVGEVTLHHATTGRIIGLVSLASHGRAFVTATTTTDVELILLSIEQLDRALRENEVTEQVLAALIIRSLTKRLARSEILQVEKIELAAALDAERLQVQEALTALEQARLELLAQERFATLGELAAGVAHELNNPVAALQRAGDHLSGGLAEVLATHPDGEVIRQVADAARTRSAASTRAERAARKQLEQAVGDRELARRLVAAGIDADADPGTVRALAADSQRLATVEAAAAIGRAERNMRLATGRISGLVASLSTYVRPDGEDMVDVDLREVVEDALRLTAHRLEGVEVERDYPTEPGALPPVPGHAGELVQVWTNILANSADALAAQAKETAETGLAPRPGRVKVRIAPVAGGVRVQVQDNGPGIDPDILPRIFEPRFTTKHGQVRFGLGLGMGLAKSVVDAHRGSIAVDSEPGRTRVTVVLPVRPPVTTGDAREAPPGPAQRPRKAAVKRSSKKKSRKQARKQSRSPKEKP
ncbi:Cyclic nucleotide-binding domain-containing protein [Actinomyces ruminicola]|uniref:histidine kinase n=1 Tax=Actinomyces ruminicola TaxID=332524 RepID=A0A1H0AN18_9ACTO|nr:ATP-binding protein [Actinomyces ruminicola]SDN34513.1 Cyclic nucleotide-binding domain-containing protein [Actinomyces ruminicola]